MSSHRALAGIHICITGVLSQPRAVIEKYINDAGGTMDKSVKRYMTHYLVIGDKVGAVKLAKARECGVKIINEKKFEELLKRSIASAEDIKALIAALEI